MSRVCDSDTDDQFRKYVSYVYIFLNNDSVNAIEMKPAGNSKADTQCDCKIAIGKQNSPCNVS